MLCAIVWLPLARRVRSAALIGSIQSALIFGSWLSFWFGVIELMTDGAPTWNLLWISVFDFLWLSEYFRHIESVWPFPREIRTLR